MLTQYTLNDSSVKHTAANCFVYKHISKLNTKIINCFMKKISQTTWVHFLLQYSTYFQVLLIHMQPLFHQRISHPVFCLLLLWPDDTKWHALYIMFVIMGSIKACCLMGTKPLPGQIHTTCNKWLAISKLNKIWSPWRSTFCDVITTCKYLSV